MTHTAPASLFPIALGLVALAASAVALLRQPPGALPGPPEASPRLAELERRLAAVEARKPAAELRGESEPRVERAAVPDPRVEDLLRRVQVLEAARAAAPAAERKPDPEGERRAVLERLAQQAARDEERARAVPGLHAKILDPRASEADKLAAWTQLRRGGKDAWTDAVVDEMARIGLGSSEARLRADVWRQADGDARSERLVPALLQALAHDAHGDAREEAAETLANYLQSAGVRAALEAAAANDVEPGVRQQAAESLGRR